MGIGEASGMFPIDSKTLRFDEKRVKIYDEMSGVDLVSLLPGILHAGENAGHLTEACLLYSARTGGNGKCMTT